MKVGREREMKTVTSEVPREGILRERRMELDTQYGQKKRKRGGGGG